MDLTHFRQRALDAHDAAAHCGVPDARAAHTHLAERYQAVVAAFEDVDRAVAARIALG